MGNCMRAADDDAGVKRKTNKPRNPTSIVAHREADRNRVDQTDLAIAEVKGRLNKLKPYRQKL